MIQPKAVAQHLQTLCIAAASGLLKDLVGAWIRRLVRRCARRRITASASTPCASAASASDSASARRCSA